ncbi:hypothetical protein ACFLV2_02530 [Chloroflexota bacterium]
METAIVSLVCIALVVFGGMTMSQGFLSSVDSTTVGLEEISQRGEEIMRTELSPTGTSVNGSRSLVNINLENSGQTKLYNFEKWDIIVQYYDDGGGYHTVWLPYTEGTPDNNEWTVQWIHLNGETETFEPNVLNPGEEISLQAKVDPVIGVDTINMVVVATPNGISATTTFSP